jgi:hypothetical protein
MTTVKSPRNKTVAPASGKSIGTAEALDLPIYTTPSLFQAMLTGATLLHAWEKPFLKNSMQHSVLPRMLIVAT